MRKRTQKCYQPKTWLKRCVCLSFKSRDNCLCTPELKIPSFWSAFLISVKGVRGSASRACAQAEKEGVGISTLKYLPPAGGVFSHPETGKKVGKQVSLSHPKRGKITSKAFGRGGCLRYKINQDPARGCSINRNGSVNRSDGLPDSARKQ